jgi:ABC-type multidrug transport system fused ATPase/permease subunit
MRFGLIISLIIFHNQVPLFIFPMLVRTVVNARVSTKRLLPYLLAPEISHLRDEAPVCVIEDDEESPSPEEFKMAPLKSNKDPKPTPGSPTINVSVKFSKDHLEVEDDTEPKASTDPDFCIPPSIAVVINDASFTWDPEAAKPTISNIDVNVPKGKLTMIVGPVGSGKSSLVRFKSYVVLYCSA